MTNKEAIERLIWVRKRICDITYSPESFEAINLAIKALEKGNICEISNNKSYSAPEIWEEISKEKSKKRWGVSYLHQDSITKSDTDMRGDV